MQGEGDHPPLERSGKGEGLRKRSAEAWGDSLRARGAAPLSIPGRCFTKQTGDLRYIGRGTLIVLQFWSYARRYGMPWKESRIVDQRLQFLSSYQKEEMSDSELCREFGVSRPTGYRWIHRYKESGPEGR